MESIMGCECRTYLFCADFDICLIEIFDFCLVEGVISFISLQCNVSQIASIIGRALSMLGPHVQSWLISVFK